MLRFTTLATLALTLPLTAQEFELPKPAPELQNFAQMIGKWQGKGTSRMNAEAPESAWTATIEVSWILNGFFVQEDLIVDMGMDSPYLMRVIYGWNAQEQRYCSFGMGNDGHSMLAHPVWTDDKNMVMVQSGNMEGKPFAGRSHWSYDGDTMSYQAHRTAGTGPWFNGISGTFERADSIPARPADASFMNMPVSDHLSKWDACVGQWNLKGWMLMPGTDQKMPISGHENVNPEFGGHVIHSHAMGEPTAGMPPWEGHSYICWNSQLNCYDLVMCDNMGEFTYEHGWWVDDSHMVSTSARLQYGSPLVSRGLMTLENGKPKLFTTHAIAGADDPVQVFEMSYSPREN